MYRVGARGEVMGVCGRFARRVVREWRGRSWRPGGLQGPASGFGCRRTRRVLCRRVAWRTLVRYGLDDHGDRFPALPAEFRPGNSREFRQQHRPDRRHVGYMWRIAPTWDVGIEGDIAWGDGSKTIAGIPGTCCGGIAGVKQDWDGSIRGRFGFLPTPAWLLYATGGIAWQELGIDASCGRPKAAFCSSAHSESVSTTEAGWTLGAGLEVMLRRNWLVRLEYRFADYGHLDHTFFASPAGDRVVMNEALQTQTLLVGFAYKLGPPSQLVAQH